MPEKTVCAAQLIHSGAEHSRGTLIPRIQLRFKEWNRIKNKKACNSHKRKYVRHTGDYINGDDIRVNGKCIDFWCEWEAESISRSVIKKACKYNHQFPKNIHYPIHIPETERKKNRVEFGKESFSLKTGTNTDPFVFGDEFYYTCCKEKLKKSADIGSLILFGSCVLKNEQKFIVDTIFVVRDIVTEENPEYEELKKKNKVFKETVLDVVNNDSCCSNKDEKAIFVGATYENQIDGMFSFFPCHESTNRDIFDRVSLTADDIHKGILTNIRNYHYLVLNDKAEIKRIWDNIVDECREKGYLLGIRADLPQEVRLKNNTFDAESIVDSVDNQIKR